MTDHMLQSNGRIPNFSLSLSLSGGWRDATLKSHAQFPVLTVVCLRLGFSGLWCCAIGWGVLKVKEVSSFKTSGPGRISCWQPPDLTSSSCHFSVNLCKCWNNTSSYRITASFQVLSSSSFNMSFTWHSLVNQKKSLNNFISWFSAGRFGRVLPFFSTVPNYTIHTAQHILMTVCAYSCTQ